MRIVVLSTAIVWSSWMLETFVATKATKNIATNAIAVINLGVFMVLNI
jgi:hypothetical protein